MVMLTSQQPRPEHAPPAPECTIGSAPHQSVMEQKEEQPMMTLLPLFPSREAMMLHPVTTSWLCSSETMYGPSSWPTLTPAHFAVESLCPAKVKFTVPTPLRTRTV
ncbi:Os12g0266401 [Oryza sativa Japonica Group]|uniref:Os12g0266401 protein n=2 Tax=Oryza sativa subsp. japonica TaxID=39947 RepID=C7J9G5_ORYSJ|nr:Os12g0266800 [Oryza sativa Japonica Group]BAT16619.1 Os12g0266401 [Oryza sativa Japonica Group]|eukprot:NP_001176887.1 Os12g0266800 [Oryza sativa Japonica Group]